MRIQRVLVLLLPLLLLGLAARGAALGPSEDAPLRGAALGPSEGAPLRVVVCDSHHHVLRHWLAAAREGLLPPAPVGVLHFDAHPDLAVPTHPLSHAAAAHPETLERALDIATFQLAAVWVGLVDRVVWLRPQWARQLPDGTRELHLGRDASGHLRVDDPADYWVLDGAWAPTASLRDPRALRLQVVALQNADAAALAPGAAILDVDLDGFATRNPAAESLRAAGYADAELERIRSAFARERLDLPEDPPARIAALDEILASLEAAAGDDPWAALVGAFRLWRRGVAVADLWYVWRLVSRDADGAATAALLENGRDLVGLPERLAPSRAEIADSAARLAALVSPGAAHPALVTIARSADDGYTPDAAWPALERSVLAALAGTGRPLEIIYDRGLRAPPDPAPPSASATPPR